MSFLNPAQFDVGGLINGVQTHGESIMSWDVQIGSLKWPESPVTSLPETFSLLRQTCAIHDESIRTLNVTQQSFASNSFCIGVPLSTSPGSSWAGLNTRAGDLLSIRMKGMNQDNTINAAGTCSVTMLTDSVAELREGSCSVLD